MFSKCHDDDCDGCVGCEGLVCVLVVVMFVVFFVKCLLYASPAECSGREALEESWSAF